VSPAAPEEAPPPPAGAPEAAPGSYDEIQRILDRFIPAETMEVPPPAPAPSAPPSPPPGESMDDILKTLRGVSESLGAPEAAPAPAVAAAPTAPARKPAPAWPPRGATKRILRCPQCKAIFEIIDTGQRPLPIKCHACGKEGVLKK
ncbi:MAG: hypothetical protein ACUVV6_08950, partial [Thermoplasmatota archaeon]